MKLFLVSAVTALALALTTSSSFAWGAHNPWPVDRADVPNCTVLDGPNHYSNNPDCETVVGSPGQGFATVVVSDERHYCYKNLGLFARKN